MRHLIRSITVAGLVWELISVAHGAGVTFAAARVGAEDVPAAAKFYERAFGLQEVARVAFSGKVEIVLNFGDTVAAAKANPGTEILLMSRDLNSPKDTMQHLALKVTDINATAAAVKVAGGRMEEEPHPIGDAGAKIGVAVDPAGNRIELVQESPLPP